MVSKHVWVGGRRFLLPRIDSMTKKQARSTFPTSSSRCAVVYVLVDRKLATLKSKGVSWMPGTRWFKKDFRAIKVRAYRVLTGRPLRKNTSLHDSPFITHKVACHLVLAGHPIARWDKVPNWAFGRDDSVLSPAQVRALLRQHGRADMTPRERRLLIGECQSAARCSLSRKFGKGAECDSEEL